MYGTNDDFYYKKSSYAYDLPERLIAQHPSSVRDESRLLVCSTARELTDRRFSDICEYLQKGDVLVINETKVLPVRLYGESLDVQGRTVEFLLLNRVPDCEDTWECLTRPGKKAREGARFHFGTKLTLRVEKVCDNGNRIVRFSYPEGEDFLALLDEVGEMPLPPYIREKCSDPSRYQTVYAVNPGSAAAPTAGFHFTEDLMQKIRDMGVTFCPVTLNIGLGTFRPVKEDNILDHPMHTERYEISEESAALINRAKAEGRRIISVGTTSCRTLEAAFDPKSGLVKSGSSETSLFLYPGKEFHVIDALITNFHLPESTLLMLVCAFWGYDDTMRAYRHAVKEGYRFFSFGDASVFFK
ncbi:MAG: tRNA preQ1(34) S-adenosylmethionine ribosyltransferase-isomerase QueA [Clostridia bacterium]|nr:tRNA preQ1(34) S-adenosylmethionine ribosyltransferase-isomerase QueA [Clostridia bacterium]